jgi:hypothetical protein
MLGKVRTSQYEVMQLIRPHTSARICGTALPDQAYRTHHVGVEHLIEVAIGDLERVPRSGGHQS